MDLAAYEKARIDWKQVSGEQIQVAGIPFAGTDRLLAVLPEFKALTGIDVAFQKIPPLDLRQKAVLDLSAKTGNLASSQTDPMYYPLYAANKWIDPLDQYLDDKSLTDPEWFDVEDIIPGWRAATSIDGKLYGLPFDGEATIQFCRKDLYAAKGLQPADTLDQYVSNAAAIHDPDNHIWGAALRGFAGPGQNMYIYPSIFCEFGGKWFTSSGKLDWNTPEALAALEWYIDLEKRFAPPGVENWNWPELGDAFGQGRLGSYIDGFTQAYLFADPKRSRVAGKVSCARWPKGPSGRRVTSIWNWSFQINGALSDRAKKATWLLRAMGDLQGDSNSHLLWRDGPAAFRREPHVDLEDSRVPQGPRERRRELHPGRDRIDAAGHRCRLATARAAMAGRRHGDGDRRPGGVGGPDDAEAGPRDVAGEDRPHHGAVGGLSSASGKRAHGIQDRRRHQGRARVSPS